MDSIGIEMDTKIMAALIGAVSAIVVLIIGNFLSRQYDNKKWLRDSKKEAYSNLVRYIIRVRNKYTKIEADGSKVLDESHQKELFDELAEVKIWSFTSAIFCSKKHKKKFQELNKELFYVNELKMVEENDLSKVGNIKIVKKKYVLNEGFSLKKDIDLKRLDDIFSKMIDVISKDIMK